MPKSAAWLCVTNEKYEEDKNFIIDKYNELGYRDAQILSDSVVSYDDESVDIYLNLEEGHKYYLRNVSWVGNTVYNSDALNETLKMKRGDVYNQKKMNERLGTDACFLGKFRHIKRFGVKFNSQTFTIRAWKIKVAETIESATL